MHDDHTEPEENDMLSAEHVRNDALEGIQEALLALAKMPEAKPPVFNVPPSAVNVTAHATAPVVNVAAPAKPKGCTIVTTRSDGSKSTSKIVFDY